MIEAPLDRRGLRLMVLGAFLLRAFVSALTGVPSQDGTNYLWMAERFGEGAWCAGLDEVFPPLWPLLVAPFTWIGIDTFRMGQLVAALCGAFALVPILRTTERVAPGMTRLVGTLWIVAPIAVRAGAECYSGAAFQLVGAWAAWALVERRFWMVGACAGLAFLVRPEGAALALGAALLSPFRGWRALPGLGIAVLGYGAARAACGHGFDPLPKLALHAGRGDTPFDAVAGFQGEVLLDNLLQLPGAWLEGLQGLGVLALVGVWRSRREPLLRGHLWVLLIALVAIVTFLTRRRFVAAWVFLLAPFAGYGLRSLSERARFPLVLVSLLIGLLSSLSLQERDRIGEKVVGEYLGSELQPGEDLVTDLTRIRWFAGLRPNPPRVLSQEELVEAARAPATRFLVLSGRRDSADVIIAELGGLFRSHAMAEDQRNAAQRRGLRVLERVE